MVRVRETERHFMPCLTISSPCAPHMLTSEFNVEVSRAFFTLITTSVTRWYGPPDSYWINQLPNLTAIHYMDSEEV